MFKVVPCSPRNRTKKGRRTERCRKLHKAVGSCGELGKPCTLPSHFSFSASPRDTSWRPRSSKARTAVQDPRSIWLKLWFILWPNVLNHGSYFGSYIGSSIGSTWFHNVLLLSLLSYTPVCRTHRGLAKLLQGLVGLGTEWNSNRVANSLFRNRGKSATTR